MNDWYNLTVEDVSFSGGSKLLRSYYKGSLCKALEAIFPNHIWYPWKFKQNVTFKYWSNRENRKLFLDWFGKQIGIKKMDDWYQVAIHQFIQHGGRGILAKYRDSPSQLLLSTYTEHPWIVWKFDRIPSRYWNQRENQRQYLEWLFGHLGFRFQEDWYHITVNDLKKNGGSTLVHKHRDCPSELIQTVFPEHNWMPWRFARSPGYCFSSMNNRRLFIKWVTDRLDIHKLEDWYRISLRQLTNGLKPIFLGRNCLVRVLESVHPDHPWKLQNWRTIKASQKVLLEITKRIFPESSNI